jgi:hypothetical protein
MAVSDLLGVDNLHVNNNESVIGRVRKNFVRDFIFPFIDQANLVSQGRPNSQAIADAMQYLDIIPETLLMGYIMEGISLERAESEEENAEYIEGYEEYDEYEEQASLMLEYEENEGQASLEIGYGSNAAVLMEAIKLVDPGMALRFEKEIRTLAIRDSERESIPYPGAKMGEWSRVNARNSRTIKTLSEALISEASDLRVIFPSVEIDSNQVQIRIKSDSGAKPAQKDEDINIYAE